MELVLKAICLVFVVGKDTKKKSQKKRFQELDKKTTKGSDEFDAYKTDDVQVRMVIEINLLLG